MRQTKRLAGPQHINSRISKRERVSRVRWIFAAQLGLRWQYERLSEIHPDVVHPRQRAESTQIVVEPTQIRIIDRGRVATGLVAFNLVLRTLWIGSICRNGAAAQDFVHFGKHPKRFLTEVEVRVGRLDAFQRLKELAKLLEVVGLGNERLRQQVAATT